jgi:hypothetical protein
MNTPGVPLVSKKVIDLLKHASTETDFLVMYLKEFGFDEKAPNGIKQIWYKRSLIIAEQDEKIKPAEPIKSQPIINTEYRTEQELLVLILNESRLQTDLFKNIDMVLRFSSALVSQCLPKNVTPKDIEGIMEKYRDLVVPPHHTRGKV